MYNQLNEQDFQERCDQMKGEFTSGLPFVCKKYTIVLAEKD